MTGWRDPNSEDYKLPSRSEVMSKKASSNLSTASKLRDYTIALSFLAVVVTILYVFGGGFTTLSRQRNSDRASLALNLDDRYSVVAVANSVKSLEKSDEAGRILEELLLITETIENPEERITSLLSISEAYTDLEDIEAAKRVFILVIESVDNVEEGASKSMLLSKILELYAVLYAEEANSLLEMIRGEIN